MKPRGSLTIPTSGRFYGKKLNLVVLSQLVGFFNSLLCLLLSVGERLLTQPPTGRSNTSPEPTTNSQEPTAQKKESPDRYRTYLRTLQWERRLPTLPILLSTIGAIGLNCSVRNGKRWIPNAITTLMGDIRRLI